MALSHEACAYRVGRRTFAVAAAIVSIAWGIWAPLAASADDSTNCVSGVAGLCIAEDISMGDHVSEPTNDTGVATYVGGDMYIGAKSDSGTNYNESNTPKASYAAEAEGLTVVNGKLLINQVKNSWPTNNDNGHSFSAGFRFGAVGYGSQFRPTTSGPILMVGGNSTTQIASAGNAWSAAAWTHGAWVNKSKEADGNTRVSIGNNDLSYTAQLAQSDTTQRPIYSKNSNYSQRDPVVANAGDWYAHTNGGDGFYGYSFGKGTSSALYSSARGDYTADASGDYTPDKSSVKVTGTMTMSELSEALKQGRSTGKTDDSDHSDADASGYIRYKYDFNTSSGGTYKYQLTRSQTEKVITFTGDETSTLQRFTLDASQLSGNDNISFKFLKIPHNASVVINVTGAKDSAITFHNGWRFWWNDTDISNYFVEFVEPSSTSAATDTYSGGTEPNNKLYASVASRLMWNFADASSVTIEGSQGTGTIYGKGDSGSSDCSTGCEETTVSDEPSSAIMGSILVPKGSLTTHVSTNGRVWVAGDYSMYNPTKITLGTGTDEFDAANGATASVVDMDQERHNLPWMALYAESGSGITWKKTDASGNPLGGTTWGVYSIFDSSTGKVSGLLKEVTDGGLNDDDATDGTIKVMGLNPSATYYIKEIATTSSTSSTYTLNPNVYSIVSGTDTTDIGTSVSLVSVSGSSVTVTEITNAETSVSWSKVDADGADGDSPTYLSGSVWTVSTGSHDSARSWTVEDNDGGSSYSCTASDPTGSTTTGTLCDTDATAGQFTVEGLSYDSSSGTAYTLTEKTAPDGYVRSDTEYSFTIDVYGKTSAITYKDSSGDSHTTDGRITNAQTAVSWSKVDAASTGTLLEGSEWTVSTVSGDSVRSWTVADNGSASYSCTASDPVGSSSAGVLCDTDATAGQFTVEGLSYDSSSGTAYSLTEKAAPDGYVKSDTEYSFTIDADGKTSAITYEDSSGASQTVTDDKITNAKAITALPRTGAWWTGRTMEIIGVALVALAGLGYGATTLIRRRDGGQGSARP